MMEKKYFTSINKKYLIIGILLPIASYYGYTTFFATKITTSNTGTIVQVKKGDIKQTIKALGSTEVQNDQKIRFNQVGTVTKVSVKQGDWVKSGTIIAELDMTDLNNAIKQDQIDLSNSQLSLQQLLDGNDKSAILSAQANVASTQSKINTSQINLNNLKTEKENKLKSLNSTLDQLKAAYQNTLNDQSNSQVDNQSAVDQAKKTLDSKKNAYTLAQKDLENTKLVQQQSVVQSSSDYTLKITNAVQEIKQGAIDSQNIINNIDYIFGFSDQNKQRVINYDSYLGTKDSIGKTKTKNEFMTDSGKTDSFQISASKVSVSNTNIDKQTLINYLNDEKSLFNNLLNLCNLAYDSVNNSIASTALSQSQIDGYLSTVGGYRNTVQSRLSNITSQIANIQSLQDVSLSQSTSDNTIRQKEQSLNNAKIDMDSAQQTYDSLVSGLSVKNTSKSLTTVKAKSDIDDQIRTIQQTTDSYDAQIKSAQFDVDNYQKQLETSKASLQETLRGSKATAIQQARNNIEQKKLMLTKEQENIKNYRIIAPFDGKIMSIDFKVGDNLVSDDTKYVYIQNPNIIEVDVLLDQVDIIKVSQGLSVSMVFYAYPDISFTGTVYQVNGIPQTSNGVTSYEAQILLDTQGKTFYSGMTQNVVITVNTKKDVLLIPSLAVQSSGDVKSVIVQNNFGGTGSVQIKTGITDGTNVEVTEGLTEGQKIVEKTYTSSSSTTSSSSSSTKSSTRTMGGGGMGGPM